MLKPFEKVKITKTYKEEPVLDLWQSQSYYFSFTHLYIPFYSKTSWQNETKGIPIMKQNQRQKQNRIFVMPYHISWKRITISCIVSVNYGHFSCGHNSR